MLKKPIIGRYSCKYRSFAVFITDVIGSDSGSSFNSQELILNDVIFQIGGCPTPSLTLVRWFPTCPLHSQLWGLLVDATMCRRQSNDTCHFKYYKGYREGEWKRRYSACFDTCVKVLLVLVLYLKGNHSRFDVAY
jgi:hypothetical protein